LHDGTGLALNAAPPSKHKIRLGVQSQTRLSSTVLHAVPLAQGESAGKIQQRFCCTNAGNFSRNPAPSVIVAAG